MEQKYFPLIFFIVSFLIVGALAFAYKFVADRPYAGNSLTIIWASLIFLFIIIGVIAISIFYSHLERKNQ
ncbi:hypothetical protein KW787_01170 [Candidatus Pacearchaeota archaeon]|nr:hypothetical protein [Candidatus Pacearchaeota archaeon]